MKGARQRELKHSSLRQWWKATPAAPKIVSWPQANLGRVYRIDRLERYDRRILNDDFDVVFAWHRT